MSGVEANERLQLTRADRIEGERSLLLVHVHLLCLCMCVCESRGCAVLAEEGDLGQRMR